MYFADHSVCMALGQLVSFLRENAVGLTFSTSLRSLLNLAWYLLLNSIDECTSPIYSLLSCDENYSCKQASNGSSVQIALPSVKHHVLLSLKDKVYPKSFLLSIIFGLIRGIFMNRLATWKLTTTVLLEELKFVQKDKSALLLGKL